jgi:hypothetical protein
MTSLLTSVHCLLLFSGGGGRLRIFRQAAAGYPLFGAKLLRGIRQRGRNDVGRRDANVLIPGK